MNRSMRRTLLHDVKRLGCNCNPTLEDVDRSMWPKGVTAGAYVEHRSGCQLGDRVLVFNRLGFIPSLISQTSRRER